MKIEIAQHGGFCSGVKNAVLLARKALESHDKVATLGDLVHNKSVMDELYNKGLVLIDSLDEVGDMPLLLQAHGTDADLVFRARDMKLHIIDGTCPLVKKIHHYALELQNEGRQVIVIGDKGHDEVMGIISRLKNPCVISTPNDIPDCKLTQKTGVVIQSTQQIDNVRKIISDILTKSSDCRIINTICEPSRRNQSEVVPLSRDNDCVLVIGDPASANSNRLFEVARSLNQNAHMVSKKSEIDPAWFKGRASVGITAGASTPAYLIDEIVDYINILYGE